jgi:hypothetical protein
MREPGVRKGISTREREGWFSWCHSVVGFPCRMDSKTQPSHSSAQGSSNTTMARCSDMHRLYVRE